MTDESTLQEPFDGHHFNAAPAVPPSISTAVPVPREEHDLLSDVESLVAKTKSIMGGDLAVAKARLDERVAKARHAVIETGDALLQQTRRKADLAKRYVEARPWPMVGVAAAVGGLIGFLVGAFALNQKRNGRTKK